jgi:uncharacterized protein involved in exopolysaccharide biosynthesis/Mrp family chromosome partitioning ATPase
VDALTEKRVAGHAAAFLQPGEFHEQTSRMRHTHDGDSVWRFFNSLRRHLGFILAMMLAGGAIAGVAGSIARPSYVAYAQLLLDLRRLGPAALQMPIAGTIPMSVEESAVDTHVTMLLSDSTLRRALGDLQASGHSADVAASTGILSFVRNIRSGLQGAWESILTILPDRAETKSNGNSVKAAERAAIDRIRSGLKVGQERRSNIISVSFASPDPNQAARVANAVANAHVNTLRERKRAQAAAGLAWAVRRLDELQKAIIDAEAEVHAYRQTHIANEGAGPDETEQQIAEILRQRAMTDSTAVGLQKRLDEIRGLLARRAPASEFIAVLKSGRLNELAQQEADLAARADATEAQRADLRRLVESEVGKGIANLESELRAIKAQNSAIDEQLAVLRHAASLTAAGSTTLRELTRKIANLSSTYESLTRHRQELLEQSQTAEPELSVLMNAEPPDRPSSLSGFLLIPPAVIAFGLLGCMISLGRDRLDTAIRGEREASDLLQVPCVGLLPEAGFKRRSIQTLLREQPGSAFARGLRAVFANVIPLSGSRGQKIIVVTSSGRREGKTTLAWGLALAAANLGRRVAVVDFTDSAARRTKVVDANTLPAPETALADVVLRGRPLSDATSYMEEAGVHYLPASCDDRNWFLLLLAPSIADLFEQLRDGYDLTIIDAPSILERPELGLLANKADKVLFAVRWGRTSHNVARNALRLVDAADCAEADAICRISTVLTRVNVKRHVRYRYVDRGDLLASPR